MKFIKKYSFVIIVILVFLLAAKSCQSCSRGRLIEYNKIEQTIIIDSLTNLVANQNDSIRILNERIVAQEDKINTLQEHIKDVSEMNTQLSKNQNSLINHINNSK